MIPASRSRADAARPQPALSESSSVSPPFLGVHDGVLLVDHFVEGSQVSLHVVSLPKNCRAALGEFVHLSQRERKLLRETPRALSPPLRLAQRWWWWWEGRKVCPTSLIFLLKRWWEEVALQVKEIKRLRFPFVFIPSQIEPIFFADEMEKPFILTYEGEGLL